MSDISTDIDLVQYILYGGEFFHYLSIPPRRLILLRLFTIQRVYLDDDRMF